MFVIVWQYQVRPGSESEFERVYGSEGDWVKLFQQAPGFLQTVLMRDLHEHGKYVTLDHWSSQEAFEQFKVAHRDQYEAMDRRCEALTTSEAYHGQFEPMGQQ